MSTHESVCQTPSCVSFSPVVLVELFHLDLDLELTQPDYHTLRPSLIHLRVGKPSVW